MSAPLWFVGTERPVVSAAPAAPAPEAAPASAVAATGCVMSWPRNSAGAWRSHAGPMGCCRGQRRCQKNGAETGGEWGCEEKERKQKGEVWKGEVKRTESGNRERVDRGQVRKERSSKRDKGEKD